MQLQPETSTEKLLNENQELRDLCCFLDDGRQKSRRLAHEWQSFGQYTAAVLRNEVQGFETKLSILQEKLQKMSQENAELRDLCLFLNQMSGTVSSSDPTNAQTPRLNSTQSGPYAGHAACVTEMNKTLGEMPQYTGFTGEAKLSDKLPQQLEQEKNGDGEEQQKKQPDPKSYVAQLEQRLERLEAEKLELVKSLSAAHILATNTEENKDLPATLPDETEVNFPPDVKAFIDFIAEDKDKQSSKVKNDDAISQNRSLAQKLSPEDILKLSTLLEISQRLDATESNPKSDPMQATEVATLRVLISISWEHIKSKYIPRGSTDSNHEPHTIEIPIPGSPVKHSTTTLNTHVSSDQQNGGIILRTEL